MQPQAYQQQGYPAGYQQQTGYPQAYQQQGFPQQPGYPQAPMYPQQMGYATPGQSIFMWIFRLPILALLGALVGGAVFVGLGIYQAAREPSGEVWLNWIGWILAAVVAVSIILFVLTRYAQAPVTRRTGP